MTSSLCLRGEIRLLNSMVSLSQTINDLIYWDDDQDYHIYMLKQEIFKYQARNNFPQNQPGEKRKSKNGHSLI